MSQLAPQFHQLEVGSMKNFVYFIGSSRSQDVFVVDPGWEADRIRAEAEKLGKNIKGILCTHSHYDHVNAVELLLKTHDVPVMMLDKEIEYPGFQCENLKPISNGDFIKTGGIEIQVCHTPGHTNGSTSYKVGPYFLTGDTIFVNGCGRCDLLSGDAEVMYDTLKKLCRELPPETIILPGHDYGPTKDDQWANQQKTNPWLLYDDLQGFLQHRMKGRKT